MFRGIRNFLAAILLIVLCSTVFAQSQPYVVMISFDGFRWDYSRRNITPNLERMKENGVSALSLKPCFPSKTFPNHISIITGMYPENHGVISNNMKDLKTGDEYSLGDRSAVKNPKWYKGEPFWETAEKNGIISASYFWPSSEVNDEEMRPTYFKDYEHNFPYKNRVDSVLAWLTLPYNVRPHFITTYFHDTDSYGHDYGPDSPEINQSIMRLDSLVDRLYTGLKSIGMIDSVNVIVLSDHGMTQIYDDKVIEIKPLLSDYTYESINDGPFLFIEPDSGKTNEVVKLLSNNNKHYRVYTKETMPGYFHFSNSPLIYSIILEADLGWSLINDKEDGKWYEEGKGNHGYDNNRIDMHATFIASGPQFKVNYKTGTLQNIDVYPLLCKLFGLEVDHKIDGKLERIEFILKEN